MPEYPPLLTVRALSKSYRHKQALGGIDLELRAGEILAFLGPNGAGKTTTVNILTGLLRQDSGEISYSGVPFDPENAAHKRAIGVVPQENNLDRDLTVAENLRIHGYLFGLRGRELTRRIDETLELVDLQEQKNQAAAELSGGLKRRAVIARALLHHPAILFLDEPSAGLDPVSRRAIHSLTRRLNRAEGVSIFLTTHYIEEADILASRVILINAGAIAATGSPAELKAGIGKYAVEFSNDNGESTLYFEDRARAAEEAAALPGEIRIREVSLEDAFIRLTGKTIGEGSAASKHRRRS